jgi:hypothetical protein
VDGERSADSRRYVYRGRAAYSTYSSQSTPSGMEKYCSKASKFTGKRIYSGIHKKIKAIRIKVTPGSKIAVEFRNGFISK